MKNIVCMLSLSLFTLGLYNPSNINTANFVGNENDKCCQYAHYVSCQYESPYVCPDWDNWNTDYPCSCGYMATNGGDGIGDAEVYNCTANYVTPIKGIWYNNWCDDKNSEDCRDLHPTISTNVLVDKCYTTGYSDDFCTSIYCAADNQSYGCYLPCEYEHYDPEDNNEYHPAQTQAIYKNCDPIDDTCI